MQEVALERVNMDIFDCDSEIEAYEGFGLRPLDKIALWEGKGRKHG